MTDSSQQSYDYGGSESVTRQIVVKKATNYSNPPDKDKFCFAFVSPEGKVLMQGKESEQTNDMVLAAIGKARVVISDMSDENLWNPAAEYGACCGMCIAICCIVCPSMCCGTRLTLLGGVPVKMDGDKIGAFAVAGLNDCQRDKEVAEHTLKELGFLDNNGVFTPPTQNAVRDPTNPLRGTYS